jgi:hypothetical protein
VAVCPERVALLVLRRLNEKRLARLAVLEHSGPQLIPNTAGDLADEDARTNFKQPAGEVPAKARRTGRENDDYHGKSASL